MHSTTGASCGVVTHPGREDFCGAQDDGQRRAQLVSHIAGEQTFAEQELAQLRGPRREGAGQHPDLVVQCQRSGPFIQLVPLDGAGQLRQRSNHSARRQPPERHSQRDRQKDAQTQCAHELALDLPERSDLVNGDESLASRAGAAEHIERSSRQSRVVKSRGQLRKLRGDVGTGKDSDAGWQFGIAALQLAREMPFGNRRQSPFDQVLLGLSDGEIHHHREQQTDRHCQQGVGGDDAPPQRYFTAHQAFYAAALRADSRYPGAS